MRQKPKMYKDRIDLYKELEADRQSKLIVYMTGDRRGLETQIHPEVLDLFLEHLDLIGIVDKISLVLYTRGGITTAAYGIVNLIRQFCKNFEVIVPAKCHSAGTLICLGANSILMTKQATLGPIDPSISGSLNPQIAGEHPKARAPVSVEAISGYLDFVRNVARIKKSADLATILVNLADKVHPIVLGDVYRIRSQIRMLGERLLHGQIQDKSKSKKILNFLCSESGSHDYTIHRREARDSLGLAIAKPNDSQYKLIKKIYDDLANELELRNPFDPLVLLGGNNTCSYGLRRGLLESLAGGSHYFASGGTITKKAIQVAPNQIQEIVEDNRTFEGWKHEK